MHLTAVLMPAVEGGFIARNPETGTCTQGETLPEALANLKEATGLYLSVPYRRNQNIHVAFRRIITIPKKKN